MKYQLNKVVADDFIVLFWYLYFRCIKGLLKNKIVVLVTHQLQFLEHADDIVCLQKVLLRFFCFCTHP